jgi:hypothetical protein
MHFAAEHEPRDRRHPQRRGSRFPALARLARLGLAFVSGPFTVRFALTAAFFGLLPNLVDAEPMSIGFRRMVDRCDVIAISRFCNDTPINRESHSVDLEFIRILKGEVKPGRHRVSFTDMPGVGAGTPEFVAFFRKGLCWRFAARPVGDGEKLKDSVLQVYGFYDWNAYFVSPGLVTLDQIETFVRDRTLTYTFRGPLYFPKRGQTPWEPSNLKIEVVHDAVNGEVTVKGLPQSKGFPVHPEILIGDLRGDPRISLTYAGSFRLGGEVFALDRQTGALQTRFFVTEPDAITRETLEAFLADPQKGHSFFRCKLVCHVTGDENERTLTLSLNDNPSNSMGRLEGWTDHPLEVDRLEYIGPAGQSITLHGNLPPALSAIVHQPSKEWVYRVFFARGEDRYLIFRFTMGPRPKGEREFGRWDTTGALLYSLLAGDVKGEVLEYAEGAMKNVASCTASLDGVFYVDSDRPRVAPESPPNRGADSDEGSDAEDYYDCEHIATSPLGLKYPGLAVAACAVLVAMILAVLLWRRKTGRRQRRTK